MQKADSLIRIKRCNFGMLQVKLKIKYLHVAKASAFNFSFIKGDIAMCEKASFFFNIENANFQTEI